MTAIDQQRTTTGMPGWHAGLDRHDFTCEPVALEPPRHATHAAADVVEQFPVSGAEIVQGELRFWQ
jgi:hypothetical protein